ncbi:IS3 family transposase [Phaeobacter gallaeciensis]|nr:IS3 family transposase [Phaeobacter gallaeciensis]MDE4059829.1 IS3 family transposase [Phaeobacter gallaeciensis]MDE4127317.1 IS3 family transposase [Phaeobacter gallaeciensis]MDE4185185.1 IS3 family transposase [Phaeobacter gallaeciensis]MDE4189406.1 IS3 family transposase [Phaeobacter gallaeciensis]MDE4197705.1 IS3 family transposase [Phaeobacter gallaeciensis]
MGNGNRPTPEFRREAVRLALTSGRTRREIAEDLGIGLSTLTRWLSRERDASDPVEASVDVHAELKRLRRENAVLKQERDILKKAAAFFAKDGKSMSFAFIEAEKASFPISGMCRVLGVSQSGFFAWRGRPACQRQKQDLICLAHIRTAFALSNGTYGSPRMHRDLIDDGHRIGRHRTARLMRENGLVARQKRRFKRTTDSEHAWPVAPNLLAQDFEAEQPDRKWGADISYIWTAQGWLYLAVVLDLHSRRVVGWATSDRLKRGLAVEALRRAIVNREPAPGMIHHSDRGSQYCSVDYQAALRKRGILISMSGKGNCYDNSMVETFFKTIKSELIWPIAWQTRQQAENAIARYIDGFYNPVRRHSSLGFLSPIAFERKARKVS